MGPKSGKQFTYALLKRRAPKAVELDRDESLARLATSYFTSHGPAQIADFAWWSGLRMADSRLALELIKKDVHSIEHDDKTYYFTEQVAVPSSPKRAFLLSIYDEYIIAYKDRSLLGSPEHATQLKALGNAFISAVIFDGEIIGHWNKAVKKDTVEITLKTFDPLSTEKKNLFEAEATRYANFYGLNPKITFSKII